MELPYSYVQEGLPGITTSNLIHFSCEFKEERLPLYYKEKSMNVRFEKDYLIELYTQGKTTDKKHRFQPNVVNGYLKCLKALLNATRIEDPYQYVF